VKKALVTGGAGFMGYHLGTHLQSRGHHVDLLDNFSRGPRDEALERLARKPGVTLRPADLRDPESTRGLPDDYTHVYHLAAIIGVANVLERPYDVLRDNVELLTRVLGVARRQKQLERFTFPSTSEVYAGTLRHFELPLPTPETTPLAISPLGEPRTSYMLSKIYGEALCHHSRVPFTIIRPHNVYGPRMGLQHVIPELLERAYRAPEHGALKVFSVDHTRTFCYVDDAVEMIRRLAEAESGRNGTFNVGSTDREMSIRQVAETVIRVVGKPLSIEPAETTPGSPTRRVPDMTRTIAASRYEARVTLEDGVRRTFEWYRSHVFQPVSGKTPA
jgi:nucleoside-diphosphate-sugar epimerase